MAEGFGTERRTVMYNDFVIVGPAGRPGRNRRRRLGERGDAQDRRRRRHRSSVAATTPARTRWSCVSGKQAGIEPAGSWYTESGTGMGDTLNIANERGAYTISDRGTYLALRDRLGLWRF